MKCLGVPGDQGPFPVLGRAGQDVLQELSLAS